MSSNYDWPDPDEVRRWLDDIGDMYDRVERCAMTVMVEAARAYLRMLEQHAPTPMHCDEPRNPACSNSFDARDWARDFRATAKALGYCDMDEGWLIGWFANAIMRGWDEHAKQQPAEPMITEWERKRVTELAWLLRANERIPDAFPSEDLKGLVPPIKMLVSIVERVIHANHTSCFAGCETLMPQQPAEPALSIEQVIAACMAAKEATAAPAVSCLSITKPDGINWRVECEFQRAETSSSPEAAIQALGRFAIAKLRERHAADALKLKELGVEP